MSDNSMAANINDWSGHMKAELHKVIAAKDKGDGAVALFAVRTIIPYLHLQVTNGNLRWDASSDENAKLILAHLQDVAECASLKGLDKRGRDYANARRLQTETRRALRFANACAVLADRTGIDADAKAGKFPVAWIEPRHMDGKRLALSGTKAGVAVTLDNGDEDIVSVLMSAAAIERAAFPQAKREQAEDDKAAKPALSVAADVVTERLASAAGAPVSGDDADPIAGIISQIAANETLWNLALAERASFLRLQEDASKAA